jgi:predicted Zn finger-like uncharacterized protein
MAEVILDCPQCRRSLRVTDDLLGRPVKCPACGMTFTVPPGQRPSEQPPLALAAETAVPPPVHQRPPSWESVEDARANARAYTMPAGILLISAGWLSIIVALWNLTRCIMHPDKLMDDAANLELPVPLPPKELLQFSGILTSIVMSAFALSIILAGMQMTRLRMYPLCIVGSVLAMLNCCNPCCVLSLPLGLWSLIVLLRTDVRAAFQ